MIVRPEIEAYAEAVATPAGELLRRLAEETRPTLPSPGMLTGPVAGRILEMLVWATAPQLSARSRSAPTAATRRSAWRALPPGGRIDTLELEPRHADVARRYVEEAGLADRITVHLGPAAETLARLEGPFDLVFVDADKPGYAADYEAVLPTLADRGLIVFDNTLQRPRGSTNRRRTGGHGRSSSSTRRWRATRG